MHAKFSYKLDNSTEIPVTFQNSPINTVSEHL